MDEDETVVGQGGGVFGQAEHEGEARYGDHVMSNCMLRAGWHIMCDFSELLRSLARGRRSPSCLKNMQACHAFALCLSLMRRHCMPASHRGTASCRRRRYPAAPPRPPPAARPLWQRCAAKAPMPQSAAHKHPGPGGGRRRQALGPTGCFRQVPALALRTTRRQGQGRAGRLVRLRRRQPGLVRPTELVSLARWLSSP